MNAYLTMLALLLSFSASAQLAVSSAGRKALAGTPMAVDGLTLTPSSNLTLVNNTIQKTGTPLTGNPSIKRLYQFSSPLLFSGAAMEHNRTSARCVRL